MTLTLFSLQLVVFMVYTYYATTDLYYTIKIEPTVTKLLYIISFISMVLVILVSGFLIVLGRTIPFYGGVLVFILVSINIYQKYKGGR